MHVRNLSTDENYVCLCCVHFLLIQSILAKKIIAGDFL